jgi:hypothetical protein
VTSQRIDFAEKMAPGGPGIRFFLDSDHPIKALFIRFNNPSRVSNQPGKKFPSEKASPSRKAWEAT